MNALAKRGCTILVVLLSFGGQADGDQAVYLAKLRIGTNSPPRPIP
jgi:uncharacterized Rossmann fold enzyme